MAIANADMAAAWDGPEGDDWSREWKRFDRSLLTYHHALLAAAAIAPDDHVLDVGCGNGQTTLDAASVAASGSALGVDLSSKMLDRARQRAADARITNASFVQADAQVHPFAPASVDVVVSRFGSMFFSDPVAAFSNIAGALVPGGRLALMVWQPPQRQAWLVALRGALAPGSDLPWPPPGLPGPFGLADEHRTTDLLTAAGYQAIEITSVPGEFWLGEDVDDAYGFASAMGFARSVLAAASDDDRAIALANLRALMEANADANGVAFESVAWLVTATRA